VGLTLDLDLGTQEGSLPPDEKNKKRPEPGHGNNSSKGVRVPIWEGT